MGRGSIASQRGKRKDKRSKKHKALTRDRKAKGKAKLRRKSLKKR